MKNMRLLLVYCLLIHHIAMFGMKKVLKPFAIAQKNYKKIPVEDLKAAVKYFTDKREKFEPNKKAYDFFSQYQALGSNIESKRLLLAELEHTYLIDRLGILKLAYENNVKEILEEVDLDRLLKLYADWGPNLDQDLRTDIRRFTDTLIRSETPITNFAFCGEAPLVLLETMPDRNKSPVYVPKLIENYAFSKTVAAKFLAFYKMYNSTRLTHERFPCQKLHNNDVGATLLLGKDDYQLYDHKTYEKKSFYDGILKKRHELGDKAIAGFSLNNFYVAFLRDEYTLEVGSVPRKTLIECLFISEERRLNPNS